MSVSARTYQVLYLIRRRLEDGATTTLPQEISDAIAERRKANPGIIYSQAYISPSALTDLLRRMVADGLLYRPAMGSYCFTPRGAAMADLLENIDACSDHFIGNYKTLVVKAVLDQRARLGQPPANAIQVAEVAGMSPDSVREGLRELVAGDSGYVEHTNGRLSTYARKAEETAPIPEVRKDANSDYRDHCQVEHVVIPDEVGLDPTEPKMDIGAGPDKTAYSVIDGVKTPVDAIKILSLKDAMRDVRQILATFDEGVVPVPEWWSAPALPGVPQTVIPQISVSAVLGDGPDFVPEPPVEATPDTTPEDIVPDSVDTIDPWFTIPNSVREGHIKLAEALDIPLGRYLDDLLVQAQRRALRGLRGADDNMLRQALSEKLFPPPPRKCACKKNL